MSKELYLIGNLKMNMTKDVITSHLKEIKKLAKEQNRKFKEVWAEHEAEKKRLAEEKAKLEEEQKAQKEAEERLKNPTQEDLLKDIRDLLKAQQVSTESTEE